MVYEAVLLHFNNKPVMLFTAMYYGAFLVGPFLLVLVWFD